MQVWNQKDSAGHNVRLLKEKSQVFDSYHAWCTRSDKLYVSIRTGQSKQWKVLQYWTTNKAKFIVTHKHTYLHSKANIYPTQTALECPVWKCGRMDPRDGTRNWGDCTTTEGNIASNWESHMQRGTMNGPVEKTQPPNTCREYGKSW